MYIVVVEGNPVQNYLTHIQICQIAFFCLYHIYTNISAVVNKPRTDRAIDGMFIDPQFKELKSQRECLMKLMTICIGTNSNSSVKGVLGKPLILYMNMNSWPPADLANRHQRENSNSTGNLSKFEFACSPCSQMNTCLSIKWYHSSYFSLWMSSIPDWIVITITGFPSRSHVIRNASLGDRQLCIINSLQSTFRIPKALAGTHRPINDDRCSGMQGTRVTPPPDYV